MTPTLARVVLFAMCAASLATSVAAQLVLPAEGRLAFEGSGWRSGNASSSHAADLNHDGYPDLIVAGTTLRTALNNGHAVFRPVAVVPDLLLVQAIATGDMDGDGNVDVVIGGASGGGHVGVLLGDGAGELVEASSVVVPGTSSLALADLDLDGFLDVVAGHDATGFAFHTLHGAGDGSLAAPVTWSTIGFFAGVDVGDWDQDGDVDVLGGSSTSLRVFLNDGTGAFSNGPSTPLFDKAGVDVALTDVGGDGFLDTLNTYATSSGDWVIVRKTSAGGFGAPASKVVTAAGHLGVEHDPEDGFADVVTGAGFSLTRLNNSGGGLSAKPSIDVAQGVDRVSIADFDGDGHSDVFTTQGSANGGTIFFQMGGTGVLGVPQRIALPDPGFVDVLAAGDLDGDGRVDLVVADRDHSTLHAALGLPAGLVGPWSTQPTGYGATDLALADVDGDGALDVVLLCSGVSGLDRLAVHLGDGLGGFGPEIVTDVAEKPIALAVGDLDGDDLPDAVVLEGTDESTLWIHLGSGDGSFTPGGSVGIGPQGKGLVLGDLDGDGALDAIATRAGGSTLLVCAGDGLGGLGVPVIVPQPVGVSGDVVVGDFDGDGWLDVGAACNQGGRVALFRNDGAGGLLPPVQGGFDSGNVYTLIAADVDDDGALDLAYNTFFESLVVVVRGDGQGGLLSTTAHPASRGGGERSLVAADLDHDGKTDLVQLGAGDDEISVLLRKSAAGTAWTSIGGGVPGVAGQPRAKGSGQALPGYTLTYAVSRAAPGAAVGLVLGNSLLDLPFKGGHLVPLPDVVAFGLVTDPEGAFSISWVWPSGAPAAGEAWVQSWIADASAPVGFSGTGGMRFVVQAP
ncbi:MAG: VCBS repeat-containing protein [Planctomycetes bacterium]|nr:VCBS repeat-containing protein [Planctomycetota bacterium]